MVLKTIISAIANFIGENVLDDVQDRMELAMDSIQERITKIIGLVFKKLFIGVMLCIGLIFGLVGLSKYLSVTVPKLQGGLGFVVVGLGLILLGWFASYFNKD